MHDQAGQPHRHNCLILAHGAGSSAQFLARAFPAAACGADTVYLEDRSGSAHRTAERLRATAAALRPRYERLFLGGVSIGAHAAAMVCAGAGAAEVDGGVLALPGWIGAADPASPTSAAAAEVAAGGALTVLRRLQQDPATRDDWVVQELRLAWRDRPSLAAELRRAAHEPAPAEWELRRIRMPTLVLALAQDPVHPLAVAQQWAGLLPAAKLVVLQRNAPADRRAVFGAAFGQWLATLSGPR